MKEWMLLNSRPTPKKSRDQIKKEKWINSQDWDYFYWHNDNSWGSGGNDPLGFISIYEEMIPKVITQEYIVDQLYYNQSFEGGDEDLGFKVSRITYEDDED
jgi:hypothetical protein